MASNLEKYKTELTALLEEGKKILFDLNAQYKGEKGTGAFHGGYQRWYSESQRVVAQLIPSRLEDFTSLYRFSGNRKEITYDNYRISDYLTGMVVRRGNEKVFDTATKALTAFQIQLQILDSAQKRFGSSLMEIKELLQADLFDDELDKARALHKNKLLREAGVVAGVVLEGHLQTVAVAHGIKIAKKDPAISDLNDPLKNGGVYEIPTWRLIQRLGDIRNLCDHKKSQEPTPDDVLELIDGVEKVIKTVF
jgi:hypothetical protein